MSEIVERVARAIHDASHQIDAKPLLLYDWVMDMRLAQARAAIEAMREPTEEMVQDYDLPHVGPSDVDYIWRSMVSAALGEGE